MRQEAARAFGGLGAAAATPATLERLVALTTDQDREMRQAAVRALGRMEVSKELWQSLGQFWQAHLENAELKYLGGQFGRVCDIAYRQLQQIATQMVGQHSARKDGSSNPV